MTNQIFSSISRFLVGGYPYKETGWVATSSILLLLSQSCALLQSASNLPAPSEPSVNSQPAPNQLKPAQPAAKPTPTAPVKLPQTGQASWYGADHQGKQTASGTAFDQAALTAAHPSLPFGTKIKVTNLANGKSVEVEITDRGPSSGNRIIDLSQAAAKALDMIESGTANVRLDPP
jgi:peptidoglycan lytic transglycosylase